MCMCLSTYNIFPLPPAEALRWGKTYWQATAEQSERPVVDVEVDACIEGSLAAESSLIVLDTMEQLMQTISTRENLHSTLGRVGREYHLEPQPRVAFCTTHATVCIPPPTFTHSC